MKKVTVTDNYVFKVHINQFFYFINEKYGWIVMVDSKYSA